MNAIWAWAECCVMRLLVFAGFLLLAPLAVRAQSLGNAGTIEGVVHDPSGAVVARARVKLRNAISGYKQDILSGPDGSFRLGNIPPNPYHLEVQAPGFASYEQDVTIRHSVPVQVTVTLALAGSTTTLTVEAAGAVMLENVPTDHVDLDRNLILRMPSVNPAAGLSDAITYGTGAVAADANGFFHPLGDHAQSSLMIDGQPISDQQSKLYSTQLPISAIQSMEVVTGTPNAEFGDKSSLIANITTRSGLGTGRTFGTVDTSYGAFGTVTSSIALGFGNEKFGNFIALDGNRSSHFLDTPEFTPFHDKGNNTSIFDRLDYQGSSKDVLHLNLFAARNWFQIPNDYDQLAQDQRQRVLTWNIAPGYQRTINAHTLLTLNTYIRKDQLNYYPSANPFNDTPATQSQDRHLLNYGLRADLSTTTRRHTIKLGIDMKQTRLFEEFGFGVTDAAFNPVCVGSGGAAAGPSTVTDPSACAGLGFTVNPGFSPDLLAYDLTRGGTPFHFRASGNINQYAEYAEDHINLGNWSIAAGLRFDVYDGLTSANSIEPRLGLSYNVKKTGTVLRAAYARTFETPYNENLLLSNATGIGGFATSVFGATGVQPLRPGNRNQFNAGLQQHVGKWFLIDADYFWKYTHSAYDFNTLLNTTLTFPIAWHNSKLDGLTGRVSTVDIHGFQAYLTFGHNRARYFPPEAGGLTSIDPPGVFRIDHDQAFQSTANFRYQRPHNAEWISLIWRYDSGLVVSGVPDAGAALALTPNQQATIGLACNGVFATPADPLTDCTNPDGSMGRVTSRLITLPQGGYGPFPSQEQDDHNPDRVKPRNVFNVGIGTDNLLHREGPRRIVASLTIANLTNEVALYNFLSTFSGTHFLEPRSVVAKIGFVF